MMQLICFGLMFWATFLVDSKLNARTWILILMALFAYIPLINAIFAGLSALYIASYYFSKITQWGDNQ